MKLLVTGHKGYIGSVLVPMLLAEGYGVIGIDCDYYRGCGYPESGLVQPVVSERIKDIRSVELEDLKGIDAVIHLAGLSNDPLGDIDPDLTFRINTAATIRLAGLAKKAGVERFIFSSSCSNYGAAGESWVDESARLNPVTPYGVSKILAEKALTRLADDGFSPVLLRSATAYGYSPRLRFDLVLNNLCAWACATGSVFIKSDGSAWRPLVHVADICRGFIAVLKADKASVHNQVFNVGMTSENFRVREIAQIVNLTVPDSSVRYSDNSFPDKRTYRVNCDRIREILPAFEPAWTVETGARQLYRIYKKNRLNQEAFEGPRFNRVFHIRQLMETGKIDQNLFWRV